MNLIIDIWLIYSKFLKKQNFALAKNTEMLFQQRRAKITWSMNQKNYRSPMLHSFLSQSLIIGMYFYLSAINTQHKIVLKNLFWIKQIELTILLRWTVLIQTK